MKLGFREILFVSVMVGLLACTYLFVFKKSNANRISLRQDMETKKQMLANLQRSTAGIDDLDRRLAELQQAIIFFEGKLPQEKEIDKILREVSQIAEANSLQTKMVKTLKSERGPNYSEQPIQLHLAGDFYGFYAFLQQLEKLPRITRITHMNLQKISDREGQMQARLTLSIFFEPESRSADVASAR